MYFKENNKFILNIKNDEHPQNEVNKAWEKLENIYK